MDKAQLKLKLKQIGLDVRDSAGKLTKSAMNSSRKMTEKVKIQNKIRKAEKKRKDAYISIGQKYQELYANQPDPEFVPFLDALAEAEAAISAAYAELSALDEAVPCPNCGKYVAKTQKFCPYCGTKSVQSEDIVEAEAVVSEAAVPETKIAPATEMKSEPKTEEETYSSIN